MKLHELFSSRPKEVSEAIVRERALAEIKRIFPRTEVEVSVPAGNDSFFADICVTSSSGQVIFFELKILRGDYPLGLGDIYGVLKKFEKITTLGATEQPILAILTTAPAPVSLSTNLLEAGIPIISIHDEVEIGSRLKEGFGACGYLVPELAGFPLISNE